jgi:hypothetical protein
MLMSAVGRTRAHGPAALALACLLACLPGAAVPAAADGLRDIASVTVTTYFDGSWGVESTDVFLARIVPALTAEAQVTRVDSPGHYQYTFYLGPVVSFTDTIYAEAVYGLGIDSAGSFSHEVTLDFNYETDTTATSLGAKGVWFPATNYSYILPSISGKFHPLPALGLFGKFFLSVDSAGVVTESFWGEADYAFSPAVSARGGFTVSRANAFGYSAIAGVDVRFSAAFSLRYSLQYLSDTVDYIGAPQPRSGIANALIADIRF